MYTFWKIENIEITVDVGVTLYGYVITKQVSKKYRSDIKI